ncbi:MAG: peptide chain release factor 2 [Puniceicoccales bacterium]|jgi:peptide chain release factor 2|nr:peptide chain release factor 2 [Puniceicoccales bacterium]
MRELSELALAADEILERIATLSKFLDIERVKGEINDLESAMSAPDFWNNQETAKSTGSRLHALKQTISSVDGLKKMADDVAVLIEFASSEKQNAEYIAEADALVDNILSTLDRIELASYLSGKHDHCNAILSIHAGAGGTESCDWADMILRMYTRWAERNRFTMEIQDIQPGEEAGISSATVRIVGENAYGYAKAERGVHRLVRISPFDSNRRRHTSFCSVDVIAEIEDDENIEIGDSDLRIDTYRSSGKGGQHVNKTESAIRITHIPTGIVVTCQNERSQHKNRESAMKNLRSRLYEKMEDEKRSAMEKFYGPKGEIGWGYQIRSYVFQPYQMVKDLRTGTEIGNVQDVMDGAIDQFIHSWLKAGCPTERRTLGE